MVGADDETRAGRDVQRRSRVVRVRDGRGHGQADAVALPEDVQHGVGADVGGGDWICAADGGREHREGRGRGARRGGVEQIRPVARGRRMTPKVDDPLGAGGQLRGPLAHHPLRLHHALRQRLLGWHLPDRKTAGRLVVPDRDGVRLADGGHVVARVANARLAAVVDGQDVDVVAHPGVEQVVAEIARPEPAGKLDFHRGIDLADGLRPDAAEIEVLGDRLAGLVARDDFIEPLETPDAPLVAGGERVDEIPPRIGLEGERLVAGRMVFVRHGPGRGPDQADPRHDAGLDVRGDRLVKAFEAILARQRFEAAPAGEMTAVRRAELARHARKGGIADVRDAERRAPDLATGGT